MQFAYLVIAAGQYDPEFLGIFDTREDAIRSINSLQPLKTQGVNRDGEEYIIRGNMPCFLQIIQLPKGRLNITAQDLTRI